MKNENKTKYYIIYDNREETKGEPTKEQFLESLLYTLCYYSNETTKSDIYDIMTSFYEEQHDGTTQEITIDAKGCLMTYKKVNL